MSVLHISHALVLSVGTGQLDASLFVIRDSHKEMRYTKRGKAQ